MDAKVVEKTRLYIEDAEVWKKIEPIMAKVEITHDLVSGMAWVSYHKRLPRKLKKRLKK